MGIEQRTNLTFLHRFGFRSDGQEMEGDPHELADVGMVRMVGDNQLKVGVQLAGTPAREQVVDAVRLLRSQNSHPNTLVGETKIDGHVELLTNGVEGRQNLSSLKP